MSNFLPNELLRRLNEQGDFDQDAFDTVHTQSRNVTSIRLNRGKGNVHPFESMSAIPWCDQGYYLDKRPVFTLDPLYHAGCYYVQEASSMFIAHILEKIGLLNTPARALDLCAAPGGKSTLLIDYLGDESLLVANEVIKSRVNILLDNMKHWGAANVVVTNNDPSAFARLPGYFDLLLVDAPCSGSGMFRKHPETVEEWSLANVKLCSERQRRILAQALDALATGGYLIYSTCSYSREENEDVIDWVLTEYGFESVSIALEGHWGIEETRSEIHGGLGYRFYPHKTKGEGFFVAVLQKKQHQSTFSRKKKKVEKSWAIPKEIFEWIEEKEAYTTFLHDDHVHVFPKKYEDDLRWLKEVLYIKQAGTNIGKWTGERLLPIHDLACSIHIRKDLQGQEVGIEVARQFLRKEALCLSEFAAVKPGWCLVRYQGVNLGWVKVLQNRINNYYPKETRIMHL